MPPQSVSYDITWPGEARSAVGYGTLLFVLLTAVDAAAGTLTDVRAALWLILGALLFAVLWPARVSAAPGLLVSRGLWRESGVRTDRLVSVRWSNGVAQRLVLRDADGNRAEIDPRVLVANPRSGPWSTPTPTPASSGALCAAARPPCARWRPASTGKQPVLCSSSPDWSRHLVLLCGDFLEF
ncbi:hypothetical protein [Streptomyces sp. SDr-06]|uniref:hypothetical protein n=1 Tax=Streptomyces sp. SDr-06 TaxID=2267702 RepID=UPI0026B822B7|nr:hypothetical protein [Streptomyces sp. SDr-06]